MKSMTLLLLVTICMLMFGCAGAMDARMRAVVSGLTGCPPDTITIENDTYMFASGGSFKAKCQGRTFYCQYTGDDNKSCKEAIGSTKGSKKKKAKKTEGKEN